MIKVHLKQIAILMIALGFLAGCASKPPAPETKAPSAATTQAIADAQAAIDAAKSAGAMTSEAEDLLAQAQAAAAAGDDAKAQDLAGQAKQKADDALNAYYLGKARDELAQAKQFTHLNQDQMSRLSEGEQAIDNNEGRHAYDVLSALNAELKAASMTYTVVRGDSLWRISGRAEVYGNPYEWPLIYKANSDKIKDADLIHPGQEFDIKKNPMQSDVDAAVQHAKTRGAWSIGKVEASDQAYLNGN